MMTPKPRICHSTKNSQFNRQVLRLASRLAAETVSVMGRMHPFFKRAGMKAFCPRPDAKGERMAAALEAVGVDTDLWHNSPTVSKKIERLDRQQRTFIDSEIYRFCQKFTNRRQGTRSPERTGFVLSKLGARGACYLWYADGV